MVLYLLHVQVLVFGRVESPNILRVIRTVHNAMKANHASVAISQKAVSFVSQVNYCHSGAIV